MRPTVLAWMAQMQRLGDDTIRAIAVGLCQPADLFDEAVREPHSIAKIIRYPSSPDRAGLAGDEGQGVGWHQDAGLLTFIHQDDAGGLQVALPARAGGEVIDATPVPGAYLLNLGEMLQLATSGYLKATRHRVVSPPAGRERLSVAFFYNPNLAATLPRVSLPPDLAAETDSGQNANAADAVHAVFGDTFMKFRIRSHPDVAAIHHADLLSGTASPSTS
jgi:isopenicillin N synthase-like dioxygenase